MNITKSLKIYEFILSGYDGSTDETDNLIKWVAIPEGHLENALPALNALWNIESYGETDLSVEDAGIDLIFTKEAFIF